MDTFNSFIRKNRILFVAIMVFITMSFTNKYFFSPSNIFGLFDSMSAYGILAIGLTFVMISGQLDISMGSVLALTSCVFMITVTEIGFIPAMLLALVLGSVLGTITGFFVSFFRLSPFIVSMTMMIAYKGIALTITKAKPISVVDPTLEAISKMQIGFIPITFFIFVAVAFIAQFVLSNTSYGRNLYIIGGNINVSDNLGLNVRKHIWSVFVVQGFLAALGGLVMLTRTFSASGNLAIDSPLSVITMVIIGGTAFSGGKGSARNTLYGVILMNVLYNAMSMFSIYANIQQLIKGVILLLIIVSDKYLENRRQKV